ncbi:RNaseH domain-containing protein [Actinopolyspora xinjiangensis]|uniref:RNaseH domain-containing protein n=1 Tax=Actinopolyspora xinjiangensis TaxID=405564 RepID=UPI000B869C9F
MAAALTARLCNQAATWDDRIRLPLPLHLAKCSDEDHPGPLRTRPTRNDESSPNAMSRISPCTRSAYDSPLSGVTFASDVVASWTFTAVASSSSFTLTAV